MNPARRSLLAYGADIPDLSAAALGITMPRSVLVRADEVIQ